MSERRFAIFVVAAFVAAFHFLSASPEAINEGHQTPPSKPVAMASLEAAAPVVPATVGAPALLPDNKSKVTREQAAAAALSAAAIAALIVQESRRQYYATGHPCACPDDLTRAGRRCGNVSAYSRPGGAAPLCYVSDVPAAMIERYRSKLAARN